MTTGPVGVPRVLVAGSGASLIAAVAHGFLHDGHRVAVACFDGSIPPDTSVGIVRLDGSDATEESASTLVARAGEELGGLDIVVRHQPASARGSALDVDGVAWAASVTSSLVGAFHLSRAAARSFPHGGAIVHVLGPDAVHAYPARSAEAAAQAGIIGLIRALCVELAPFDVRVNAVIAGPLADDLPDDLSPALRDRLITRAPSARLGRSSEVADAVRFVADGRSSFMTGQTLRVDGGWASLNQAPDGMRFP